VTVNLKIGNNQTSSNRGRKGIRKCQAYAQGEKSSGISARSIVNFNRLLDSLLHRLIFSSGNWKDLLKIFADISCFLAFPLQIQRLVKVLSETSNW